MESAARALKQRGMVGVAGHTLVHGVAVKDRDAVRQELKARGIDAVVVLRPVAREQEFTWEPGTFYGHPHYGSFRGYWGYGWGTPYDPGYLRADTVVTIETMIYSLSSEELIWAGRSPASSASHPSEASAPPKLSAFEPLLPTSALSLKNLILN